MAIHATVDEAKVEAEKSEKRRFVYEIEHSSGNKCFVDAKSQKDALSQYNTATILKCAIPGKPAKEKKEKKAEPVFDYSELGEG